MPLERAHDIALSRASIFLSLGIPFAHFPSGEYLEALLLDAAEPCQTWINNQPIPLWSAQIIVRIDRLINQYMPGEEHTNIRLAQRLLRKCCDRTLPPTEEAVRKFFEMVWSCHAQYAEQIRNSESRISCIRSGNSTFGELHLQGAHRTVAFLRRTLA